MSGGAAAGKKRSAPDEPEDGGGRAKRQQIGEGVQNARLLSIFSHPRGTAPLTPNARFLRGAASTLDGVEAKSSKGAPKKEQTSSHKRNTGGNKEDVRVICVCVCDREGEREKERERKKHRERGQHLRLLEMTAHTAPNAPNEKENESMCACVCIEVSGVFPCTRMYTNYLTVSVCRVSVSVYVSILVEAQVVEATVMCGNGCEGDDAGGHSRKSSY